MVSQDLGLAGPPHPYSTCALDTAAAPAERPAPSGGTVVVLDQAFDQNGLFAVRSAVAAHASHAGLSRDRVADLVVVANELATNAVRHGGGRGRLRMWSSRDAIYCSVSDAGPGLAAPDQAGRELVPVAATAGRGLWIVRQLADQMMISTGTGGTTATVVLRLPATGGAELPAAVPG